MRILGCPATAPSFIRLPCAKGAVAIATEGLSCLAVVCSIAKSTVIPNNPSDSLAASHLPLHKGGFEDGGSLQHTTLGTAQQILSQGDFWH